MESRSTGLRLDKADRIEQSLMIGAGDGIGVAAK